jgi:hypothetical protein
MRATVMKQNSIGSHFVHQPATIGKLKTALNLDGIEVDISGAGGHVPVIERRIEVIKQRVRAYMSHRLPYTLNKQGIGYCVLFCVSRLNYEVRVSGPESQRNSYRRPCTWRSRLPLLIWRLCTHHRASDHQLSYCSTRPSSCCRSETAPAL